MGCLLLPRGPSNPAVFTGVLFLPPQSPWRADQVSEHHSRSRMLHRAAFLGPHSSPHSHQPSLWELRPGTLWRAGLLCPSADSHLLLLTWISIKELSGETELRITQRQTRSMAQMLARSNSNQCRMFNYSSLSLLGDERSVLLVGEPRMCSGCFINSPQQPPVNS